MQIEQAISTNGPTFASSTVAKHVTVTSLSNAKTSISINASDKSSHILKQAITPISGKSNLLKLLNGSKSTVFKTIGDRIVVPMKVCATSKASLSNNNASIKGNPAVSTFQMAIPAKTVIKSSTSTIQNAKASQQNKIHNLHPSQSTETKKKIIIKSESPVSFNDSAKSDLNQFMNSVTKNVFFPIQNQQQTAKWPPEDQLNPNESSSKQQQLLDAFMNQDDDGELTSLSWLSSNNKELLKTIRKCNPDDPGIGLSGDETDSDEMSEQNKLIFTASSRVNPQNSPSSAASNDFMYNPLSKPPYSFSCLIFMAIEDSYLKRLPVKDIYSWVCKHFPYYRSAPSGWKNSIRHNLSLNRCFKKAEIRKDSAKGSLWCIDPAFRPNLLQALKRSPFYPYLHPTGVGQPLSLNNLANLLPGAYSGRIPSWTPTVPPSTLWADPDMASAAINLMGLRNDEETSNNTALICNTLKEIFSDADWLNDANTRRSRTNSEESIGKEQVVISGDAQDHTYTVSVPARKKIKREEKRCKSPESEKSAPDAAYEFETASFSNYEFDDEVMEIVENVELEESRSDPEEQSLFDSGFGSLKCYSVKTEETTSNSRARRSLSKAETGACKTTRTSKRSKKNSIKRNKPAKKTDKLKSRSLTVRLKNTETKKKEASRKNNGSDVDSGKDSPKVVRAGRSRRLRQRSYKRTNQSTYHTRSSRYKLLGQEKKLSPKRVSKRKRKMSCRLNDDEEVKLAAGSLMRLAGLLKSPLAGRLNFE